MNPFKTIENQKKLIYKLQNRLKYSKDKVKAAEEINILIQTVNDFESTLVDNYKIDVIDKLICYIIKDWIINLTIEGGYKEEIPLKMFVDKIDSILEWQSGLHVYSLANEINGYLIGFSARRNEDLNDIPSTEHYEKLIKDLLYQFKKQIIFNK